MLYGRYKCLKSTFQFILTDIGCDKEAVSFFESQGFFLIADRTFSFHDENAYEGSLVDLAEHFFDVLSVENELIYGKVRAGYDMRFEGLLLSAMNILFYIRPVYFSTSFFLSGNDWSYLQASGYKENGSNRLFSLSEISVLYLDRFLFLLPGLFFSPWLSIYWRIDSISMNTLFLLHYNIFVL